MTERELKAYISTHFPQENEQCEWKEFKNLKHAIAAREGDDVISYVSAIANMNGGHLIIGVEDDTLKAEYIANRSFDDAHFKEMIVEYLRKFGKTKRTAIDKLVIPKLSNVLSDEQKKKKVTNFLSALRKEAKIRSLPGYYWELV